MKKFITTFIATTFIVNLSASAMDMASAEIIGLDKKVIGSAEFRQGTKGVVINIKVSGLKPGKHGMHFHEVGTCNADDKFASAGAHIGHEIPHGFFNPEGPHSGNLPNLVVGKDGNAEVELYSEMVTISECEAKPFLKDNLPAKVEIGIDGKPKEIKLDIDLMPKQTCKNPQLLDLDGSTLIIHENPDDHQTQPIGGSGNRVACGAVK
jgi:Cu-Zn family superoxide dismutase